VIKIGVLDNYKGDSEVCSEAGFNGSILEIEDSDNENYELIPIQIEPINGAEELEIDIEYQ
jgi:hypothetical protein